MANPNARALDAQVDTALATGERRRAMALLLQGLGRFPSELDGQHRPAFLARYVGLLAEAGEVTRAEQFLCEYNDAELPGWWHIAEGRRAAQDGRVADAVAAFCRAQALMPDLAEPPASVLALALEHRTPEAVQAAVALAGGEARLPPHAAIDLGHALNRAGDHQAAARLDIAGHGPRCRILQTCDNHVYWDMLLAGMQANRRYADLTGASYEAHIGVMRGYHPWHATFNRIPWLSQLLDDGYYGWVLYIDADAYVVDLGFDLWGFLAERQHCAMVPAMGGDGDPGWDVNVGVFFLNLGDPRGQALVRRWRELFHRALPPSSLLVSSEPFEGHNDQGLLHAILREDAWLRSGVSAAPRELLGSSYGSFIRQHLRAAHDSIADRVALLRQGAAAALAAGGTPPRLPRLDMP